MIMLASMLFAPKWSSKMCFSFPPPSVHANLLILNIFLTFCKRHWRRRWSSWLQLSAAAVESRSFRKAVKLYDLCCAKSLTIKFGPFNPWTFTYIDCKNTAYRMLYFDIYWGKKLLPLCQISLRYWKISNKSWNWGK